MGPGISKRPTLSICIPTYNRADHLESALAQLEFVRDWGISVEVVISDNASSDATSAVIEAARTRLPVVRSWRQQENVPAEANLVSALRRARGECSVYLADDDELLPERVLELVRLFEQDDQLTACYCPWESWNARDQVGLGLFYQVDRPRSFERTSSLALFEFLVQNGVFPEIAVYRTQALQRVLYLPHHVHWAFVSVFRLLLHGRVRFEPEPFYRHVTVARAELSERSQVGLEQAVTSLDSVRGGLEVGLRLALQVSGLTSLSEPLRMQVREGLEGFLGDRAAVAARICAGRRDFVGACEFQVRDLLWQRQVDPQAAQDWQARHLPLAVIQTLAETLERTAGVDKLVLCGIQNADALAVSIRALHPELDVQSRSAQELNGSPDVEELLVVVDASKLREDLLGAGFDSGRVILWGDLVACLRVW